MLSSQELTQEKLCSLRITNMAGYTIFWVWKFYTEWMESLSHKGSSVVTWRSMIVLVLASSLLLISTVKRKDKECPAISYLSFCRKLIGKLNFLTNTKLEIAYNVQYQSQFMQNPREPHPQAAFICSGISRHMLHLAFSFKWSWLHHNWLLWFR